MAVNDNDRTRFLHGSPACTCLFCWGEIERLRAEVKGLTADLAAERAEVERLMDSMEWAWSIIANAQYWDATDTVRHPEWEQAKFKWRDEHWHPALDRNKEARRD